MLLPTVVWAQRKDKLYLTIDLQDVEQQTFKLDNTEDGAHGKLSFQGKAGPERHEYSLELEFNKSINVSESKVSITPRHIFIVIAKNEPGHWPRLTKEPSKHLTHIKCDWDKWVDEDEEDESSQIDMSNYGNFSSFDDAEGFGPGEEDDSDNEELPDLVK